MIAYPCTKIGSSSLSPPIGLQGSDQGDQDDTYTTVMNVSFITAIGEEIGAILPIDASQRQRGDFSG